MSDSRSEIINKVRDLIKPPTDIVKLDKALAFCNHLLKEDINDIITLYEIARIYSKKKLPLQSIKYLNILVELQPKHSHSRYLLARSYSDLGKWKEAVKHAKKGIEHDTVNGKIQINFGNIEAISILGTAALYDEEWNKAQNLFKGVISFLEKTINNSSSQIPTFNADDLPNISKRKVYPVLYLPIEVKAREFESKVLLALTAAESGLHVVFGRTWVLSSGQFSDLSPGIILFKTLNAMDANNMAIAKINGRHLVCGLDEEAFGRSVSSRALKLNVEPLAIDATDLILIQGKFHLESWKKNLKIPSSKIYLTGNPKIDLLKNTNIEKKQNKKKNILFCTMSGNINPQGRSFARTIQQTLISGSVSPTNQIIKELSTLMNDTAEFEINMIPQLKKIIEGVADNFQDCNIIVRPHPIENQDLWVDILDTSKHNLKIENTGPLTDWLRISDIMIHVSGCGSGVEAALNNTKAIRFEGEGLKDPDVGLSSSLNHPAKNLSDVINIIEKMFSKQKIKYTSNLNDFIFKDKKELTSRIVAKKLFKFYKENSNKKKLDVEELLNLKMKRDKHFDLNSFHLQKFPNTSCQEVDSLIRNLSKKFGIEMPNKVDEIEDGLFLLQPKKNINF